MVADCANCCVVVAHCCRVDGNPREFVVLPTPRRDRLFHDSGVGVPGVEIVRLHTDLRTCCEMTDASHFFSGYRILWS